MPSRSPSAGVRGGVEAAGGREVGRPEAHVLPVQPVPRMRSRQRRGRLVSLLTDFGLRDHYTGTMKGVAALAAGAHPGLKLTDETSAAQRGNVGTNSHGHVRRAVVRDRVDPPARRGGVEEVLIADVGEHPADQAEDPEHATAPGEIGRGRWDVRGYDRRQFLSRQCDGTLSPFDGASALRDEHGELALTAQ